MKKARVVVLISGTGSNLQSLIDASRKPDSSYDIVHVISNRPNVAGLDRARAAGISADTLDHNTIANRDAYEAALTRAIDAVRPDWIACAGFMRIMGAALTSHFEGRMINIHPSLLPNFPGLHTHQRALDAGVAVHGCTVHWVTAGVDEGAIIGQAVVPVHAGDTEADLVGRVQRIEHRLFPACLQAIAEGHVRYHNCRNVTGGRPGPALTLLG